jgi:hypothetical protein
MKLIAIIIAILLSNTAIAGDRHHGKGKPGDKPPQASGSTSNATGGAGIGMGGAGGSATGGNATAGASAASASTSGASASIGATTFAFTAPAIPAQQQIDTRISGTTTVRQAPDMALLAGSPTATCMNVIGLGGSGSAGGGLLSFSVGVEWCKAFEMARQARNHGLNTLAEDLMCNVEEVKALNSRDCYGARKRAEDAAGEKSTNDQPQIARALF